MGMCMSVYMGVRAHTLRKEQSLTATLKGLYHALIKYLKPIISPFMTAFSGGNSEIS